MDNDTTTTTMPVGSPMSEIRKDQVTVTPGGAEPAELTEDAVARQVWMNYEKARQYIENNAWLLEWQETDILYQSPVWNRYVKQEAGRTARVPRFLVAKFARTLSRAMKRGLFAEQYPFFLRPTGKTTTAEIEAWTALLGKLLKRAKFRYHAGLMIDTQVLQGTGIAKGGVVERTITRYRRVLKGTPTVTDLPDGSKKEIPTVEGDEFEIEPYTVCESYPFFEYRRLGTTLFDPKWCTPDLPDESAGYCVDVDYVTFEDLQTMRELECYENIPSEEALKNYFFQHPEGSAPVGTQVEDTMSSQGSAVAHAEARNRSTDENPLAGSMMKIAMWNTREVKEILVFEGRKLTIRNETHCWESSLHYTATWWPIDNSGYGMGVGRLAGPDQRINQGVINACLQLIAYPLSAPILIPRGENAPTQNTISRLGGYQQVDVPPGGDVRKGMAFMEMPSVPADAWKFLQASQQEGEELTGASAPFQQGNLQGPGSSAARTATGAGRIAAMSDQNVADPIDSFAQGVIVPFLEFLVRYVKLEMPISEIRNILSDKHAAIIEQAIRLEQFIKAEFEVDVLAGQKLAARSAIQQLIPFFLQIVQQPQLLQFLHEKGETIDFKVIMDLMLEVSELTQQPDIFRTLTPQEKQQVMQMSAGASKMRAEMAKEQLKGENKVREIETKGEVDRANKAAEIVAEHTAEHSGDSVAEHNSSGIPLERATGLLMRSNDKQVLQNGLPSLGG